MTNIDQFESVFKAAAKTRYEHAQVSIERVLVVTDLDREQAETFAALPRALLDVLARQHEVVFRIVETSEFRTAGELLAIVEQDMPGLVCTYRNLQSTAWQWPHSLGVHVDLLTQTTATPVLVLPHPDEKGVADPAEVNTMTVMAIADHLTGDDRLVHYAAALTDPGGTLWLTHVEDHAVFERYMEVISKIPEIDTELARQRVLEQLLREPHDYIRSCREVLAEQGLPMVVEELVTLGHHLGDYQRLVAEHEVDLLVLNTKDEGQLAMHGIAYSLAVELRDTPLLML